MAKTCSAVTKFKKKGLNFKSWYCCIVDGKQLKINSKTNSNRMLSYIDNSRLTSQWKLCLLQNLNVHRCVHKIPPLVPSVAQPRWTQSTPSHPISLGCILILLSHLCLELPRLSSHWVFWPKLCMHLISTKYATCHTHLIPLQIMKLLVMQLPPS
jgi:hypothetical protein